MINTELSILNRINKLQAREAANATIIKKLKRKLRAVQNKAN